MKVILNEDVKHLGEEGDIKDVAKGYARNYLFPRNLAVPCNSFTLAHFESRKEEIEQRKAVKRQNAAGLKEQLENLTLTIVMPAGPNGKLLPTKPFPMNCRNLDSKLNGSVLNCPALPLKVWGIITRPSNCMKRLLRCFPSW